MRNIVWKNMPGVNGWGDALNKLSYLYRTYENEIVRCSYRDKIGNWSRVNLVRKHVLKRNTLFRMNCTHPRYFERDHNKNSSLPYFLNPTHDYWPARISHNEKNTGRIAFHFYINNFSPYMQTKIRWQDFNFKIFDGDMNELKNDIIKLGYEPISLYDLNINRGFPVISDPVKCIKANMEILSNCDYYVGTEGFMSHVCRAMRVPGIFYRNDSHRKEYQAIANSLEQPIHHLVSSSEQILFLLQKNT